MDGVGDGDGSAPGDEAEAAHVLQARPAAAPSRAPALEVTSASTRRNDERRKRAVYAALGVRECFLYDPRAEWLAPPLQGWRLHEGAYRAVPAVTVLSNRGVAVASEVLGLELRDERDARMLRLRDPATGEVLLTHEESERARAQAEARVAELEARLRALEGTSESQGRRP